MVYTISINVSRGISLSFEYDMYPIGWWI